MSRGVICGFSFCAFLDSLLAGLLYFEGAGLVLVREVGL